MSRILVVEDDWRIGAFIDRALTHTGYHVCLVHDGTSALAAAADDVDLDLVVLDLMLPDVDGVVVARQLRSQSAVPILMLTARDSISDRVRGLDAGADDYLVKPFALEELLARIRAMLRRQHTNGARAHRGRIVYHDLVIDRDTHEASVGGRTLHLRNREFQLLAHFVRNAERVVSRRELLDEVWGTDFPGASNVIEVTIAKLRRKLEVCDAGGLIRTVRPVGYILRWPRDSDTTS